jgi:hypothetical protein
MTNFPHNPQDVNKKLCSWRSKSKPCLREGCDKIITNLPKSLFITRKYCSQRCSSFSIKKNKRKIKGSINTKGRLEMLRLIARVVHSFTTLDRLNSGILAQDIIGDHNEKVKT